MDFKGFKGAAKPLDVFDIPMLAHRIRVHEDPMHAFVEVECAGKPFDKQGRPAMLFEPHLFYRNLSGSKRQAAVAAGLAYPSWGTERYPTDSYPRLLKAMEIDETAALKSASWGASQMLGSNHSTAGHATVQAMVTAFMADAEEHIEAMVKFILANGIDDDIRAGRWETVARVYNGPAYAKHGYHTKLAAAARKWGAKADSGWQPDAPDGALPMTLSKTELKAVQARLHELGYNEAGTVDGAWGSRTRAAVLAFRADHGLPIVDGIDAQFLSALMTSKPREIGEERATATAADLREAGSTTIKQADTTAVVGTASAAVTGLAMASDQIEAITGKVGAVQGLLDTVQPLMDSISSNALIFLGGLALFMIWQAHRAKVVRVQDHRDGKNVGR